MFNKEEQRRRAAELSASNLAKGIKPVSLPPIQVSKSAAQSASAWPIQPAKVSSVPKETKMSVKYLEEPFENEFGQFIPVGSKIIAVKQGYNHTIGVDEGVYLGLRRNSKGDVKNVTVKLRVRTSGYFLADGTLAERSNIANATYGKGIVERRVTLPRKRIYPTS